MDVTQPTELEALQQRIADLEQQLAERHPHPLDLYSRRQWRIVDTALSHTPDSTYIFDPQGRLIYANKVLLDQWGKRLHEAVGKTLAELGYPPEVVDVAGMKMRQVVETGQPVRGEVSMSAFTATPHHYEYIFVPVFAADGTVEAVTGSTRDITDRFLSRSALQKANAEIVQARQQLVDIFESMTDAFFALDNEWRFTYVNYQAEKVLFRTRDELLGKNVWEEFAPALDSTFYREYHRAKAENRPVEFEEYYPPLSAWFEVRAIPSPEGLGVYFHDINERKAAQEALQKQARELAHTNADLQHFAYAAAHDLQEPLRMVSIFTQLLQNRYASQLDEQGLQYIAYAVSGATRMQRLVRDLLAYTSITSTEVQSREPVDAEQVLNDVLSTMRPAMESAGAQVSHTPLPSVVIDPVHLQQLFQNLIGNAIKYRSEDVPRIHISASKHEHMWRFAVQDNGIGIPPEYTHQVFGLFKRLHTKDEYEGTGIGLAICQKIVQRYGGRIWVESKLGQGSTFFFTIPV